MSINSTQRHVAIHLHKLVGSGFAVTPVREGHETLILVGVQFNSCASLVHHLSFNHCRSRVNGHHVVVGAIDGQCQFVGINSLKVSGQCLVSGHGVLELSLGRNFLASSVRPIYKVVAEVLGSSQSNLAAFLVLFSSGIDINATSFFRSNGGSQRVGSNISLCAIYDTCNRNLSNTTSLGVSNTNCTHY